MKHSIQPLHHDNHGVLRFQENPIVQYLLEAGPFDLNILAGGTGFDREDWEHFAQIIGYSLDGWGSLNYVSDTTFEVAYAMSKEEPDPVEQALRARIAELEARIRTAAKALEFEPDDA